MPAETQPVTIRLSIAKIKRIFDAKEKYPQVYPERMREGRYNRSTFINLILDRGLAVIEAELESGGWTRKGTPDE